MKRIVTLLCALVFAVAVTSAHAESVPDTQRRAIAKAQWLLLEYRVPEGQLEDERCKYSLCNLRTRFYVLEHLIHRELGDLNRSQDEKEGVHLTDLQELYRKHAQLYISNLLADYKAGPWNMCKDAEGALYPFDTSWVIADEVRNVIGWAHLLSPQVGLPTQTLRDFLAHAALDQVKLFRQWFKGDWFGHRSKDRGFYFDDNGEYVAYELNLARHDNSNISDTELGLTRDEVHFLDLAWTQKLDCAITHRNLCSPWLIRQAEDRACFATGQAPFPPYTYLGHARPLPFSCEEYDRKWQGPPGFSAPTTGPPSLVRVPQERGCYYPLDWKPRGPDDVPPGCSNGLEGPPGILGPMGEHPANYPPDIPGTLKSSRP